MLLIKMDEPRGWGMHLHQGAADVPGALLLWTSRGQKEGEGDHRNPPPLVSWTDASRAPRTKLREAVDVAQKTQGRSTSLRPPARFQGSVPQPPLCCSQAPAPSRPRGLLDTPCPEAGLRCQRRTRDPSFSPRFAGRSLASRSWIPPRFLHTWCRGARSAPQAPDPAI